MRLPRWRIGAWGIAAVLLFLVMPFPAKALSSAAGNETLQADFDDCNASNDPTRTIRGCSNVLARGSLITASVRKIALISRAVAYLASGDFTHDLADADAALVLAPSEAPILSLRGQALAGLGRHDEAVAVFSQAIAANKNDVDDIARRARSYAALSQSDRAIADFRTVIRLHFNQAQPYLDFGRYQFDNADYAAALELFQHAVANGPNNAIAYYWRGRAFEKTSADDKAADDFAAATHLNAKLWSAWLGCAKLSARIGDADRAHACYVEAAKGPDTDPDAIAARAALPPTSVAVQHRQEPSQLDTGAITTPVETAKADLPVAPIPPLVARAHRL